MRCALVPALVLTLAATSIAACSDTRLRLLDASGAPADPGPAPPPVDTVDPGLDVVAEVITADTVDVAAPEDTPKLTDEGGADTASDEGTLEVDAGPTVQAPPPRVCEHAISWSSFGEPVQSVAVAGEHNGWSTTATPLGDADGDGVWTGAIDTSALPPGSYGYKLVVNGDQWQLDPENPMRKHVDGVENSKLLVEDCERPLLELESLDVGADSVTAVVRVRDGASEPGLLAGTASVRHGFDALEAPGYDAASQRFTVSLGGLAPGKHSLLFGIANPHGDAAPLSLPVWVEAAPFQWSDAVLYFAMTDRFHDGDPATGSPDGCLPADSNANWRGGDWAGVRQKIEAGYFTDLGVSAIWLTAVVDNPPGCFLGQLSKHYTSYHGYFPSAQLAPEEQLGTMADLQALVAAAHERQIRVLVDLVANHLHDSNPLVGQHPDDGWFNGYYQCGFDEAPLTCWFESYLPDLNYEVDDAVEAMTDMALWWIREADLDGFRIDAVKHMQDNFVRTLRHKIGRSVETTPGSVFWMVGETFAGGWGGGTGPNETSIKKYINPDMLHGQFDFPLYWRILRVFARDDEPPLHVADLLEQSQGYYGSQAVMSRFLGNHDLPRFISHATGDIPDVWGNGSKEIGWDNPPQAPTSSEPYERLALAFSLLFTVQGVPLVYYGDEIGLPGAGDPDNRRMMTFDGWSADQQKLYAHIGALAKVRAGHATLRRGSFATVHTDDAVLAFLRSGESGPVLVALNRSGAERTVSLAAPSDGEWSDGLTGATFTAVGGSVEVSIGPWGARILAP